MFSLLRVNSIVSIKSSFKVINHTVQGSVLTLIYTHFLPLPDCQTETEWEGLWKSTHFVHLLPLPLPGIRQLFGPSETGGPIGVHPWSYEFTTEPKIRTPLSLHSWAASQACSFIHSHKAKYFHSLHQRDMVVPQQAVTISLWEVIRLPFGLLRQAWIRTWDLTSMKSDAPTP
jgi:hypothetical protein